MKHIITLAILAVFSLSLYAEEKVKITQTEKEVIAKRAEIRQLIEVIQKEYSNSNEQFIDAKNEAEALKKEYDYQQEVLTKVVNVAAKSTRFKPEEVKKAKELQASSKADAGQYNYQSALKKINEALTLVALHPVVSLSITPRTVSNNFDKMRFDIDFTSPKSKIASWQVKVYNTDSGNDIVVKHWSGTGTPPTIFEWDGTTNGEFLLNSASEYAVEALATDARNETGTSGRVTFKTDIFARKADRGLIIDVSSIEFAVDKAELKDEYLPIIKKIYNFLVKYPEYKVIVEGHSDYQGNAWYNKNLSEKRANSVKVKLIETGLSAARVKSYGLGEALPKTEFKEKMALNRRVVFILIKGEDEEEDYLDFVEDLNLKKETTMKSEDAK